MAIPLGQLKSAHNGDSVDTDVSTRIFFGSNENRVGTDDGNNTSESCPEDEVPFLLEHESVLNTHCHPILVRMVILSFPGLLAEFSTGEGNCRFYHSYRPASTGYIPIL